MNSVETEIRRHLQANDAIQDPIDFEEIASRLEDDRGFERNHGVDAPSAWDNPVVTRGLLVAAAAAIITLLLFGLIPLLSGGKEIPPADTSPPPTTPTTAVPPTATGERDTVLEGDITGPFLFTSVLSDPLEGEGPLVWRTVQVPSARGELFTGADGRFYQMTASTMWVSDDAIEWEGYRIDSGTVEWPQALEDDGWMFAGSTVFDDGGLFDLSSQRSGRVKRVNVPRPDSAVGFDLLAIGPKGAIGRADNGRIWHSTDGEDWTESFVVGEAVGIDAIANEDGFFIAWDSVYFSSDGVQWEAVHRGVRSTVDRLSMWGNGVVTQEMFSVWRVSPAGSELLYESSVPFDMFGPGDVAGSELGVLAVGLDLDGLAGVFDGDGRGYAYSSDGVDWEQGILPEGWAVTNVFVEEAIVMNDETILVIASGPESDGGGVLDGNRVLMASP